MVNKMRSANAERVSDGVGVPFRRSGTGVRRRWSAIPEVRNGCLEAPECHSGGPERVSGGSGVSFRTSGTE